LLLHNITIFAFNKTKKMLNMLSTNNFACGFLKLLFSTLLIIFIASCANDSNDKQSEQANQSLKVTAIVAEFDPMGHTLQSTGTVLSNEEVELRSEIAGRITEILFREGGSITQGQTLIRLNDKEIRAELQKMVFEKNLLEEKESRQRQLLNINAISREEYDISLNSLNVAKAHIALLNAQLEKTELKAPFSGVAGLRLVSIGAAISPSTIITTLQNINPLKLEFSVPEKYSREIKEGTKINFTVEGLDSLLVAEVFAVEPRIDPKTRTLKMRALFSNERRLVLPGAFANIRFKPNGSRISVMVPSQAIIPDAQGTKVFIQKNGSADYRAVETGYRSQTHVEITSGIQAGDTVLTSGILHLRPGMPVHAIINQ
jgi:membrane fusion protein, multidrug efflux system